MYRPLPDILTIKKSNVEGLGLFTNGDISKNIVIGITHVKDDRGEGGYIRTPLGGFINHSEKPNCELYEIKGIMRLRTLQDIKSGDELTLKYKWYNPEKL